MVHSRRVSYTCTCSQEPASDVFEFTIAQLYVAVSVSRDASFGPRLEAVWDLWIFATSNSEFDKDLLHSFAYRIGRWRVHLREAYRRQIWQRDPEPRVCRTSVARQSRDPQFKDP